MLLELLFPFSFGSCAKTTIERKVKKKYAHIDNTIGFDKWKLSHVTCYTLYVPIFISIEAIILLNSLEKIAFIAFVFNLKKESPFKYSTNFVELFMNNRRCCQKHCRSRWRSCDSWLMKTLSITSILYRY